MLDQIAYPDGRLRPYARRLSAAAARADYPGVVGWDVDPCDWAPTPFTVDEINRELVELDGAAPDIDET